AQYNLGVQYYVGATVRQDYPRAIDLLRRAAQAGHGPAAFVLGYAYESGTGVKADLVEARKWFEQAGSAGDGDRVALFNVVVVALRQRDAAAAVNALRVSAEKGYPRAQAAFGRMLEQGQGTPKNEADAVTWYRTAAEAGDPLGAFFYGAALGNGVGGGEEN